METVIFKIPNLKGYIKYENGKFTTHNTDPDLRYMKLLMEIAKEWIDLWLKVERKHYDN